MRTPHKPAREVAQLLTQNVDAIYSPWWLDVREAPGFPEAIVFAFRDPDEPDAEPTLFTRTIQQCVADLNEFLEDGDGAKKLCCLKEMRAEGFDFGCAEDADQLAQYIVFGKERFS